MNPNSPSKKLKKQIKSSTPYRIIGCKKSQSRNFRSSNLILITSQPRKKNRQWAGEGSRKLSVNTLDLRASNQQEWTKNRPDPQCQRQSIQCSIIATNSGLNTRKCPHRRPNRHSQGCWTASEVWELTTLVMTTRSPNSCLSTQTTRNRSQLCLVPYLRGRKKLLLAQRVSRRW